MSLGLDLFLFWELFVFCALTCAGLASSSGSIGCKKTEMALIVKAKPSLPPNQQTLLDELNLEIKQNLEKSPIPSSPTHSELDSRQKRSSEALFLQTLAPQVVCETSECLMQADVTCENRKNRCSGDHEWMSFYTLGAPNPFVCCRSPSLIRSKIIRTVPVQLGEHAFMRGFEQDGFHFGEAVIGLDIKSDGTTVIKVARFKCSPKDALLPPSVGAEPPLPPNPVPKLNTGKEEMSKSVGLGRSSQRGKGRGRGRGRGRGKRSIADEAIEMLEGMIKSTDYHPRNLNSNRKTLSLSSELRQFSSEQRDYSDQSAVSYQLRESDQSKHHKHHHHHHHHNHGHSTAYGQKTDDRELSRQRRSGGFKDMLDKPGCNSEWESTQVVGAAAHGRGSSARYLRSTTTIQESQYCGVDVRERGWGFSGQSDMKY